MTHLNTQLAQPPMEQRRWRFSRRPTLLYVAATLVALLMTLPVVYLVIRTAGAGSKAWAQLVRPATFEVLVGSAALALVATVGSLLIGVPLAWLTTRTDLPGRRVVLVLAMLPLAIPSYIGAWAMIAVIGPKGLLQQVLEPLGVDRLPSIYGFWGAALALTLFGYPYVLLGVRVGLRRLDPALEEASRSLGHNGRTTFWRVTVPQLRPALTASALLVTLYTLSDFGVVSLLRYNSFTRAIYQQYRSSFDRTGAAVLALVLVALTLVILAAETLTRGRSRYYRSSAGVARYVRLIELGRWRWLALGFCGAVILVAVMLPVVAILSWLLIGLRSGQPLNIQLPDLLNSLLAAGLAAGVAVGAALPVVFLAVRHPGRMTTLLERCAYVGYALPGIVVALSLVFWGAKYALWAYQTLAMLVLAYLVRFLPQAIGSIRTTLLQISPRLEEAAQALGQSRWQSLRSITLPLLTPGLLSGAALVFLSTLKELPATLLLGPTGFDTLATDIWHNATEVQFSLTAFPALLLMGAAAGSLALLLAQDRRG